MDALAAKLRDAPAAAAAPEAATPAAEDVVARVAAAERRAAETGKWLDAQRRASSAVRAAG